VRGAMHLKSALHLSCTQRASTTTHLLGASHFTHHASLTPVFCCSQRSGERHTFDFTLRSHTPVRRSLPGNIRYDALKKCVAPGSKPLQHQRQINSLTANEKSGRSCLDNAIGDGGDGDGVPYAGQQRETSVRIRYGERGLT